MITKEDHCNALRWRLLELQEAKMRIEQEISVAQENVNIAEDEMKAAEDEVYANFEDSGISADLYNSYLDFCESLDPEFGQRGGFSVTCNSDHENSYTNYDPEFSLFKDCIDMPYTHCNFRSEASVISPKESIGGPSEYIVEFWPIKAPEPLTGTELTWGEQYVRIVLADPDSILCSSTSSSSFLEFWFFSLTSNRLNCINSRQPQSA